MLRLKLVLLICVSFIVAGCAVWSWPSDLNWKNPALNDEDILAFVGENVFVRYDASFPSAERISSDKTKDKARKDHEDEIVVRTYHSRYVSRFLLKEAIIGTPLKENVDFAVYLHVGEPDYKNYSYALIILEKQTGEDWQSPDDLAFEVYLTKNGKYALCGDVSNAYRVLKDLDVPLEEIQFSPPVIIDWRAQLSKSTSDEDYNQYLRDYYSEPWFEQKGDKAKCQKGIYAADLVALLLSN